MSKVQTSMAIRPSLHHNLLKSTYRSIAQPVHLTQNLPKERRSVLTPVPFAMTRLQSKSNLSNFGSPKYDLGSEQLNLAINDRFEFQCYHRSDGFLSNEYKKTQETEDKEEENKGRALIIKEARLMTKEEELNKKELRIQSYWEKNIEENELAEIIKTERMNINRMKKEVEAKEKAVEEKMAEVDLLEEKAINNPYFKKAINQQRKLIYGN